LIDLSELRVQFPTLTNITPLATGGQKEVCRAESNGVAVALKIILPAPDAEERVRRELEAVRTLSCAYVPRVIDSGERLLSGRNRFFIIDEFIAGETYRSVLQRQPAQDFQNVLKLALVLISAAADFERIHVVHRDIKPENLMVDQAGKIWILDFGIARHLKKTSLTPQGGWGIGTIGYAPPEQYRNIKPEIDARADLFAIGMVLHEALYGTHYYWQGAADEIAVVHKMDKLDLPRLGLPEDASNALSDLIATLTQRYASRRPKSAAEALAWFQPIYQRLHAP